MCYTDSPINRKHGFHIIENVINTDTELELHKYISELIVANEDESKKIISGRESLHYGYTFDFKQLKPDNDNLPDPIPDKIKTVIDTVLEEHTELADWDYNQITINRYQTGDKIKSGIGSHVDTHSVFDDKIVVISLDEPTCMIFELPHNFKKTDKHTELSKRADLWLKPRSLMIMSGISRYLYKHRIPHRKTDIDSDGNIVKRGVRTSITIRKVTLDGTCDCDYPIVCDYQNPSSLVLPTRLG